MFFFSEIFYTFRIETCSYSLHGQHTYYNSRYANFLRKRNCSVGYGMYGSKVFLLCIYSLCIL